MQLEKAKVAAPPVAGIPPFPEGKALRESLVIALDAQKALVLGGCSEEYPDGTDQVWVWDFKKKTLTPSGPMKAKRAYPENSRAGQGALKLADGSVLIW